jgi:hypothetical protein
VTASIGLAHPFSLIVVALCAMPNSSHLLTSLEKLRVDSHSTRADNESSLEDADETLSPDSQDIRQPF